MEEIVGHVERITFQNPENGFTIAQLSERKKSELTCIVGTLPSIHPGETIRCKGSWQSHLIYGRQFAVTECKTEAPADIIGIKKYLGSGLIKGIGPKYAGLIVEKFGIDTLDIIDKEPHKLLEIKGLGKKRKETIEACWSEQKSIRNVMIFLQSHGVSPAYAQKIYKNYGAESIEKVQSNPYRLARDIYGIGFKIADTIAEKLGIGKHSIQRIDAGIEYVLTHFAEDGHVCTPLVEFLKKAEETLETPEAEISPRTASLQAEQRIEVMDLVHEGHLIPFIWTKFLFTAEVGIAKELKRLKSNPCALRNVDEVKALIWVQEHLNIALAAQQQQAVAMAISGKVEIITGGPGTGKSTITNAILTICSKLTPKIMLAAPTGRAAKRMSEITGFKASTIHSLLEFDYRSGFKRKRDNPLDCDLLIVDEASMIDTSLMYSLLKAVPNHCRLILVGDINQLPSVGPGNVLKDLIDSHCLPVTILTEIFRQAAGSRIVTNAHRINRGEVPDIRNLSDTDFYFVETETPEKVLDNIVMLVGQRLPQKYKFDPLTEIQVLTPMRKGIIGAENLNRTLQGILNPSKKEPIYRSGNQFHEGDKVMQLRNNYKKDVFNGDIGKIAEINLVDQQLVIIFDDRPIEYEFSELDEITLAYAVSVHKYQGSECPCIVMPVHTTHFKMLHRNLLYTAVTRGKKLVVLVGSSKALFIAVKNDEVKKRYSGLQQALCGILNPMLV
ncbi:MAG: ATP-dependent RecD-like DNA helicase [Parachlamydiaceae bacterium]|nr:ATP-dependent RecD-like DNA helicase [Parachlamydiaceae bacterium]